MNGKYTLCVCTDFTDELSRNWYDMARLEKLFAFYRDMGARRIYWVYTLKHAEGVHLRGPLASRRDNAIKTFERTGEFLPAAVAVAKKLEMEIYAVYKPFDLGYHSCLPFGDDMAKRHGKLDSLSGKLHWITDSLVQLADKRLERHPADMARGATRIGTIKIAFDTEQQCLFRSEDLLLLISDDNNGYRPYAQPYRFRVATERDNAAIYLEDLDISSPYLALKNAFPVNGGHFKNVLAKLVVLYDRNGEKVPFTYGLLPRAGYWKTDWAIGDGGYLFDNMNTAVFDGYLKYGQHAIDGPTAVTAIAIGKERFIHGALSPAYPEVRKMWLNHISECVDAGVDGVDIRPEHHNRSLEWERYGFEKPVRDAYRGRFGEDIWSEPFDPLRHRKLLGEFYTLFCREASDLLRSRGRKTQLHIGRAVRGRSPGRRYMNFYWEWENWIKKGIADEVTLKDSPFFDAPSWERIAKLTLPRNVPAYHCTYWNTVRAMPDWRKRWTNSLRESLAAGQSGCVFYESAMLTSFDDHGELRVRDPDLPNITREFVQFARASR